MSCAGASTCSTFQLPLSPLGNSKCTEAGCGCSERRKKRDGSDTVRAGQTLRAVEVTPLRRLLEGCATKERHRTATSLASISKV
jgi:hypothetical protein